VASGEFSAVLCCSSFLCYYSNHFGCKKIPSLKKEGMTLGSERWSPLQIMVKLSVAADTIFGQEK
jgi:hypothetical protein